MKGQELHSFLTRDPVTSVAYRGIYSVDSLPSDLTIKYPLLVVINTGPKDSPGEHWVTLYINPWQRAVYFDSYGLPPLAPSICEFLQRHSVSWTYSDRPVQDLRSTACGLFCLYFLYHAARGASLDKIHQPFCALLWRRNDVIVFNWYRETVNTFLWADHYLR